MNSQQNGLSVFRLIAALLNLTGLGIGYLYLRCWFRWAVCFLWTLILFATAYLQNASRHPWVWLSIWGLWLLWMALDAWRQAAKRGQATAQLVKNSGLHLAVAVVLLVVMVGSIWGYHRLGEREIRLGKAAYRSGNCTDAVESLERATTLYELTLNPQIATLDSMIEECKLLLEAEKASEGAGYEAAVGEYMVYLEHYPDGELEPLVNEQISQLYLNWAATLRQEAAFEAAIEKYETILQQYTATLAGQQAPNLIAETYWDWAGLLCEKHEYAAALEKYQALLEVEPRPFTDVELHSTVAEMYWDWAAYLRENQDYEAAAKKYQSLLDGPSQAYTAMQIQSVLAETYAEWAIDLARQGSFDLAFEKCEILQNEYADTATGKKLPTLLGQIHNEMGIALTGEHKYTEAMQEFELAKQSTEDEQVNRAAQQGYETALLELAQDTSGEGKLLMEEARENVCLGTGIDSPAFGLLQEPGRFLYDGDLFTLSPDLDATMPGHLKYVICAEDGQKFEQRCRYVRTYSAPRFLSLQKIWWRVWVNDPRTGKLVQSRVFWGSSPGSCPMTYQFSALEEDLIGRPPSAEDIMEWLRGLLE